VLATGRAQAPAADVESSSFHSAAFPGGWSNWCHQALTPAFYGLAAQNCAPVLDTGAQGINRVHVRLSVPTLFMPTPP